ncbi:hypothetical protein QAD02_009383 [Eretmocerus hayati]|uniref:Uncharacterized protein n=1 Tax=Eretmocerus hayati TaxID=131215 RepID=A0ACC2N977_9HYME|nr:hypothetical protein QAD02_009383 [Eretmocerus hayati]
MQYGSQPNIVDVEDLDYESPKEDGKPNTRQRGRPRKIQEGTGSMLKYVNGGKNPFEAQSKLQRSPTREGHSTDGNTKKPADKAETQETDGAHVNNNNTEGDSTEYNSRKVFEARIEELVIERIGALEDQVQNLWNEKANLEGKLNKVESEVNMEKTRRIEVEEHRNELRGQCEKLAVRVGHLEEALNGEKSRRCDIERMLADTQGTVMLIQREVVRIIQTETKKLQTDKEQEINNNVSAENADQNIPNTLNADSNVSRRSDQTSRSSGSRQALDRNLVERIDSWKGTSADRGAFTRKLAKALNGQINLDLCIYTLEFESLIKRAKDATDEGVSDRDQSCTFSQQDQ